jgi:hypothetical protein
MIVRKIQAEKANNSNNNSQKLKFTLPKRRIIKRQANFARIELSFRIPKLERISNINTDIKKSEKKFLLKKPSECNRSVVIAVEWKHLGCCYKRSGNRLWNVDYNVHIDDETYSYNKSKNLILSSFKKLVYNTFTR